MGPISEQLKLERKGHGPRYAPNGECSKGLIAVATERLEGSRFEGRSGKCLRSEPVGPDKRTVAALVPRYVSIGVGLGLLRTFDEDRGCIDHNCRVDPRG